MEYETTSACFKNASARNLYVKEVCESFEKALGRVELICLYENFKPRLEDMENGGELDVMALEIINARYHGYHARLDEQAEWVHKLLLEWEEKQLAN